MNGILELAADGQRQIRGPELSQSQADELCVTDRVTVLDEFVRQEANADRKILADLAANVLENPADQSQATFERVPAIVILARICPRKERSQRIGMGRMQLGTVEAGLACPRHRVAKFLDNAVDLGERQHIHGLPPTRLRHFQEMDDLRDHFRVRNIMNAMSQIGQARHELIVADAQKRAGLGMMNRHGLDHDQTRAALCVSDIAIDDVLVDEAVFAGQPRHHRRNHDPIRNDHCADVQRFE